MPDSPLDSAGLLDRAFTRATGAHPLDGNRLQLLRNGAENYPAWLEAIASARHWVHLESYIIHDDHTGRMFADALMAKARQGVHVAVLYDWWGARGFTRTAFWRRLRHAGVDVRVFNPPLFDSPLGWLRRDHRKMVGVDGRVAFVAGLCIGDEWTGDPARGIEPWRDTGIRIEGPAVAQVERAFASTWGMSGPPLPSHEIPDPLMMAAVGGTTLRVIASYPSVSGLFRLDQIVAGQARQRLWLTDAYFVATTLFVQTLRAAAEDGVDVRLLVPGATDIAVLRALSRASYRALLEVGIRVFEWNGPMLHAKTAVADGRWARVGSSNLNPASWLGNWELDIAIEDSGFAAKMEGMYLEDLAQATEIVLSERQRVQPINPPDRKPRAERGRKRIGRATAGAIGIGSTVGAAAANRRPLGRAEAKVLVAAAVVLLVLIAISIFYPRVITIPLSLLALWLAAFLIAMAIRLHRKPPEP
ncbi:MAG TPA: phospholipase D-like domain-containing protein [Vicinamibacterales bacterium]|jgi:cardiolipin synthase